MIYKFKAKLRAWLIDLVREAIRTEKFKEAGVYDPEFIAGQKFPFNQPVRRLKPAPSGYADALTQASAPSFEQMQADAIEQQTKFYEVAE